MNVVAIDGPVGVGKSTVAKGLADRLHFFHLDTGAMYRALTLKALRNQIDFEHSSQLATLAQETSIDLQLDPQGQLQVFCDTQEVTQEIRSPEVSRWTSPLSDVIEVRKVMVAQQRRIGEQRPTVAEGRDMTTVVFPDARWKFYLEAKLAIRVQRRQHDLQLRGVHMQLADVLHDIQERDRRDRSRPYGALQITSGVIVVDTTTLSAQQVIELLFSLVKE